MLRFYHSYLQRRYRDQLVRDGQAGKEPTFPGLVSQLCTQAQMCSHAYLELCKRYRIEPIYKRKRWEYGYILQALAEQGQVKPGKHGLGFGVGRECLVAALASQQCSILATDLPRERAARKGWEKTGQYAGVLEGLNQDGRCDPVEFRRLVTYRDVDMNHIDDSLKGFDFLWSSCALEHLGSIELGLRFVMRAMDCLKPGGVAVHTTEFNLSSNERTVDKGPTVLFRRQDMEALTRKLEALGHQVAPFNWNPGSGDLDHHVDLPPYQWSLHLKLLVRGHAVTSLGFIVRKAG
jgi:hypothetical protein